MATAITNGNALPPNSLQELVAAVTSTAHQFLEPTPALQDTAIAAAKSLLDPLAAEIVAEQTKRKEENRKKRNRGDIEGPENVLQLRQVYTKGLGAGQVWEQCRRILDAACDEVERGIGAHERGRVTDGGQVEDAIHGVEVGSDDDEDASEELSEGDLSEEYDLDEEDDDLELNDNGIDDYEEEGEGGEDVQDMDEEDPPSEDEPATRQTYVADPNDLNDGFFDIEDFNKQSQFLEQQDVRGEEDDRSDEDDIDWDADPLTMSFSKPKPGRTNAEDEPAAEDDAETEEDDGPTFENGGLDDTDDEEPLDEDAGLDAMPGLSNTNDIRYSDFFEPPPKKLSKTKRMRALPKTQPLPRPNHPANPTTADDDDIERAISSVRRDILDSASEPSDPSDTENNNLSTHEKQRLSISAEIRRLEAASIAKRDWTLIGEARASDRPLNSLIEEDFAFERTGKPVPVITNEVSEEIEALIKRRILAREFDEVLRRRPDVSDLAEGARRGRVELDDSKSKEGLAEMYEVEYARRNDPSYLAETDKKTKRAHEEIALLWGEVRSQLESLSNLHFKPKRAEVVVKVVEDKARIGMEDVRPVAEGVDWETGLLAPQEVYTPGSQGKGGKGTGGEVVTTKGGMSLNKEELSREEKLRRRRREKERVKKGKNSRPGLGVSKKGEAGDTTNAGQGQGQGQGKVKRNKKDEQQNIIEQLKKGNVQLIGKKGDVQDMGTEKRTAREGVAGGGGAYKL